MTNSQKLTIRLSEIREKLNELLGIDKRTDEQNTEMSALTAEAQKLEPELRAAIVVEGSEAAAAEADAPDAETRERRELRSKARLSTYVAAAMNGRAVDGAAAECSAAHGCPGAVPLELFDRAGPVEERAVTPGPATADTSLAPIVPALFQRSVAAYLGIDMPTVGVGDSGYPVLSTSVTGGPKAESADAAETAGAFTVTTARPRRITGVIRFTREDAARLDGLESALRQNLADVLSDAGDNQALNGSGSGDGTLNGLSNILTDPDAPAAGAEDFGRYNTAFLSHIDGTFAVDRTGIRGLVGLNTYRHMGKVWRSNETDLTALDLLDEKFGGVRASARIADPANKIQQAIIRRTNPAGDRVAVMPVWQGLELIRDPYTAAGKGEIMVTGVMLVGDVVVLRSGAFVQDSFRLVA